MQENDNQMEKKTVAEKIVSTTNILFDLILVVAITYLSFRTVPRFKEMYLNRTIDVPLFTRLLMNSSWIISIGIVGFAGVRFSMNKRLVKTVYRFVCVLVFVVHILGLYLPFWQL